MVNAEMKDESEIKGPNTIRNMSSIESNE